ncbi:zinc finger protein weckle [Drosophila nasuta]|uniref:zinc finger protein weckle n=1 Tax=Drosophila nasuta TaxID=42062 RepID=UPI00295E8CE8|nr:zinc finger protein weckle [Drosophila nasuta]
MTGSARQESTSGALMAGTETADWHHWCRLCAKEHSDNVNVYFRDGDQTWTSVLAVAIGKYFWVNIKMEDELSNALCKECYTLVEDLIEFSDRVNRVQTLFSRLQQAGAQAHLKFDDLRRECGVLSDEWKHIISKNEPSEEPTVEETDAETSEYVVDDVVESYEAEAEIMAEIDASEIIENDENAYDTYEEAEDTTEDVYLKDEESSQDAASPMDPKGEVELVDTDATTTTTTTITTNEEEIKESSADVDELSEVQQLVNEEASNGQTQYKCSSCNKCYKKPMAYKRHMAEVHGLDATDIPNLECKRCKTFFATENQLTAHYRSHMPAKDKADNACSYCPKLFTTPGALKRHIMFIHENVKPYICDCCGKGMKTITALNEHKLVHTDECPFECPVCQRRFKNMARLKIHSDTHTNKNYVCNICGLKLNTRRTLNMHQLVHSDAKQFKCDVCGAAFKRGKTLKAHLILHTGIRPYKCNFCGKDFANGSNCRMHKRKTHPKELAEEEARGVMRSTYLPMITELTETSKRVKKPAKATTALTRTQVTEEITDATDSILIEEDMEEDAEEEVLYEIVEDCA